MAVNLQLYKGFADIEQNVSIPEWEALFRLTGGPHIFNHPYFVMSWFKTSRGFPVLIRGDIGSRKIIFPMELYKRRYYFYKQKILFAMGGLSGFDFQDPLISGEAMSPVEKGELWEELFRLIRRKIPECDQILIQRLRAAAVGDLEKCEESTVSPYIDLRYAKSIDDVLSKCKASHRGDVKRQIRRLKEKGPVNMRIFLPDEKREAQQELTRFLEAWERQWSSKALRTAEGFYRHLVESMLKTGLIHFSVLKCGDDPLHWHFGFLHGNRLHWFKPTFNLDWRNYSPGKVHIAYLIEECIKSKIRYFDFLYGDEAYKYDWAPIEEKLYCLRRWNGFRPMPRFVEGLVKPAYCFLRYRCLKDTRACAKGKRNQACVGR